MEVLDSRSASLARSASFSASSSRSRDASTPQAQQTIVLRAAPLRIISAALALLLAPFGVEQRRKQATTGEHGTSAGASLEATRVVNCHYYFNQEIHPTRDTTRPGATVISVAPPRALRNPPISHA